MPFNHVRIKTKYRGTESLSQSYIIKNQCGKL